VRPRRRILLYTHDGLGLGHLRRTLALAIGIATRRPDAALLLLTGSPQAHEYARPTNCDFVKLPSTEKRDIYYHRDRISEDDPHAPAEIFTVREAIIAAAVESFAPHLILIDNEPGGLAGELREALPRAHGRTPRPKLVVGLRDITWAPKDTRSHWDAEGVYELLDHVYDHILVYGQRDVFDPIEAYGLSPVAAAKTTFTGYVRHPERARPRAEIRERLVAQSLPLVVVTVGGGLDGGDVLRAYVEAVSMGILSGVTSYVVAGPQLPAEEFAQLRERAKHLPQLTLVSFSDVLVSLIAAADAVVTMGGYNAVCEAVAAGQRPIVIPRAAGSSEQRVRAERFAALGLVTYLPPSALTPGRLAMAVRAELERCVSPPALLDFDGLDHASDVLASALDVDA
jgi:predicted glycosyltransferase